MSDLLESRYRYDPSGDAVSNLIIDEVHEISASGARIVLAREGVFYTRDFSLRPVQGGAVLVAGVDYHFIAMDVEITAMTGLETASGIELENAAIVGEYALTYRCVGGVEGRSQQLAHQIKEAIEESDNLTIDWNKLINVPAQFPPVQHTHQITDLTALEKVSQAINGLERALLDSRPLLHSANQLRWQDERILSLIGRLTDRINQLYATIADLGIDSIVERKVAIIKADLTTQFDTDFTNRFNQLQLSMTNYMEGYIQSQLGAIELRLKDYINSRGYETEIYPGLNVYDCGSIDGPSFSPPGSQIEPDSIDLNDEEN